MPGRARPTRASRSVTKKLSAESCVPQLSGLPGLGTLRIHTLSLQMMHLRTRPRELRDWKNTQLRALRTDCLQRAKMLANACFSEELLSQAARGKQIEG